MKPKIVTLGVAELVEDMSLYPRHAVDDAHVRSIVYALECGAQLPPVVADEKTKKITDGWHRCRAYARHFGPTATIEVQLVNYKSEAEMLLDAVARNAVHGRKLDAVDKTRSVVLLRKAGCTDAQIAVAINIPEAKIEKLVIRLATAPKMAGTTITGTNKIALKRPVLHMAGTTLTREQAEAHAILPGTSFLLIARQLYTGLTQGMVNLEDEKLVTQLKALAKAIKAALDAAA